MSGFGEASLVLGLISSAITIFEAAQEIYEAVHDPQGLPKKFRAAAEQIPLVHHALSLAEQNIRTQKVNAQALHSAIPVLERCKKNAASIKDVFEKSLPSPGASRTEHLRKAMALKMKKNKVMEDMQEVVKDMELLAQHQIFQDAIALEEIKTALEQLDNLSDGEDTPQFMHSGAGAINANTGSGQQRNYNSSGSGHQYNAEKQFFGRDQVSRQHNFVYQYYFQNERASHMHRLDAQMDLPHSPTASETGFLATIGPRRYIDVQERVEGTCVWLTDTVQYHSWAKSSRSSILWITGGAGTGKTIMMNYLVEYIRRESENCPDGRAVCSFFCSRDIEGQHDVSAMLQDLVLQLIENNVKALRQIKSAYWTTKQDYAWSFETVWRMFQTAIDLSPSRCVYIIIDALDECDDTLPSRLLKKLATLVCALASGRQANPKKIKIIIGGQPRIRTAWISEQVSFDHHHIDVEATASVAQDVSLFVKDKVSELVRAGFFTATVGQNLGEVLGLMSENSFLWLTVVFQHIKTRLHYRQAHLEDILAQVPRSLQQAYARYVPHVETDQICLLQCYLQLFVAASRPLKLAEIDIFALLQDERLPSTSTIIAEDGKVVKASIQRALGPLIRFPQDTAQFIHSAVKEYFIQLAQQPAHQLYKSHGTDPTQAHLSCFRLCTAYLMHESVPIDLFDVMMRDCPSAEDDNPVSNQRSPDENADGDFSHFFDLDEVHFLLDGEVVEDEACDEIRERLQAYDYAATNWAYHLAHCEALVNEDDIDRATNLLSPESGYLENWYRYSLQQSQLQRPTLAESSPIILAAMFNLTKLIHKLCLTPNCHLSLQDLSSALYWASSRGNLNAVELLLDYGAPVSPEQSQRLPLVVAAQAGFPEVCKRLLAADGIDPNQSDSFGKPALVLAAEKDHVDILRLLLLHPSIDVDRSDLDDRTALIAACRSGSTESVRALRKDGRADVNRTDMRRQSSLHHASIGGDLETIKEFVEFRHVDLNAVDQNGRNAISLAAQEGNLHVVKALHRMKVNAASVDRNGRNAVSWAANSLKATRSLGENGETLLEYLVERFPDQADVPDEDGWTPLAWALDTPGFVRSVWVLTRCPSVDINRRDEANGKCILAWAASAGMTEIVRCLLCRTDLEVDRSSFNGWTALTFAAANGREEIVELLLQVGNASPHRPDHQGKTPADWAELNGFIEIATLLRAIPGPRILRSDEYHSFYGE